MHTILPKLTFAAALSFAALSGTGEARAQAASTKPAPAVEGKAMDAPQSRVEAEQAIDAATAAALIGAISSQFGERKVEVKLDHLQSEPVNLIDQRLHGDGRLRIGDDPEWLPLRFGAVYDSAAGTVAQPRLTVGDEGPGQDIAVTSELARALQAQASTRLHREFSQQPATLRLDRVTQLPAGGRYLRLEGVGAVDFADQGSSMARVRALYDRRNHQWLQVGYELGAASSSPVPAPATN